MYRPDPFENRVPSIDGEGQLGSESELCDDEERGAVQTPPIKLAMWVSWLIVFPSLSPPPGPF